MILIQLRQPPISLFIREDFKEYIKKHGAEMAPYSLVKTLKEKEAIVPLKNNTNIAYIRESSEAEAMRMTAPQGNQQIQPPGGMIIGKSGGA